MIPTRVKKGAKVAVMLSWRIEPLTAMTTFDRIRAGASLVLLVAIWLVPWTTFSDSSARVSLSYGAGGFQWPLTAVVIAIVVVQTIRDRGGVRWAYPMLLGLVILSGALSAVTALADMARANSNTFAGFQQSRWNFGTFLALIASITFLVATLSERPGNS